MKTFLHLALLGLACSAFGVLAATHTVHDLTLEQALEMAENLQPELAGARAMVEAADGRARQAGAFPNPEVIAGALQLPLGSDRPNEREYVAGVGQSIPLSRRLSKARQAELFEREVRARGLEVKRREIHRRVRSAFATALYQEQAHQAQQQIHKNSAQAVSITQARAEVGDALREDVARVQMEQAGAQLELQRVAALRDQAMLALASAIGDATLDVASLEGSLETAFDIPTLESLAANLPAQPEMALAEADLRAQQARVDLAKAERIPDVKIELLYHRLEATQANTLDLGLSIPLPLFNRNQGRLRAARAEVAAAEARRRLTRNELTTRVKESHRQLTTALAASRTLKTEILPRVETVLKGAEARYTAGDASLADILPVRRDWATMQLAYLESLRDAMLAWVEVKTVLIPR